MDIPWIICTPLAWRKVLRGSDGPTFHRPYVWMVNMII